MMQFVKSAKEADKELIGEVRRLMAEEGCNKNKAVRKACRGSGVSASTLFKWLREEGEWEIVGNVHEKKNPNKD